MPVMLPSAELLAQWAAEQLWDWRVRAIFAAVCALAALATLVIYLKWGRGKAGDNAGKARRYAGRVSVILFVIAAFEALFFKEPVSTLLLLGTAIVVGIVALSLPRSGEETADGLQPIEQE